MDVVFLQEADVVDWKMKKIYQKVINNGSVIIFNPEVFGKVDK